VKERRIPVPAAGASLVAMRRGSRVEEGDVREGRCGDGLAAGGFGIDGRVWPRSVFQVEARGLGVFKGFIVL